ncbi:hypothetical protein ACFP2F_17145 [Hymenobacter artigasi]|uniref:Uncharacterized protein n=1 Tax=Hymenobacter artigasi TaxID=2719616 RepID=A0ABX1HN31_9BACT|nr:hypothetical protein [Hymenobacter artigasi]NKI91304.1 hypothetical protein [Hymenobacter artigasi]
MATKVKNEHHRTQAQVANDGSDAPTDANVHGAGVQQQGAHKLTKTASSEGHHGGNHGNDVNDDGQPAYTAKGSSNKGSQLSAEQRNSGGGSDQERKNQAKNTTAYNTDNTVGNASPSSANDGGKIGDADNPI